MATSRTNRLALDENYPKQAGKDVDTGKAPAFTLAAPWVLTAARIVDGAVAPITDWTAARLQVASQCNKNGDRYVDQTVTSLNQSLTQSQWDAGTAGHAVFAFTATDLSLALAPCDNGPLYFVVTATRSDGQVVPMGVGTINVDRAHQFGTNLVLSPAGTSFPLLALGLSVTEGPLGGQWISNGPNQFTLALSIPFSSYVPVNYLTGEDNDGLITLDGELLAYL